MRREIDFSALPVLKEIRPQFDPEKIIVPAKSILRDPQNCWVAFSRDRRTIKRIFEDTVFMLAAIPAVCGFIGEGIFGRMAVLNALALAVAGYALSIGFLYGAAHAAHRTAWLFNGTMSLDAAAKLIVYSFMPFFLAGIFLIHPQTAFLAVCGVYGLYLFYHGVRALSGVSSSRLLTYYALNVVGWVVTFDLTLRLLGMLRATR